jgi:hypothetical protein
MRLEIAGSATQFLAWRMGGVQFRPLQITRSQVTGEGGEGPKLETCNWLPRHLPRTNHAAFLALDNTGFALLECR